jgi:hypothetical protein
MSALPPKADFYRLVTCMSAKDQYPTKQCRPLGGMAAVRLVLSPMSAGVMFYVQAFESIDCRGTTMLQDNRDGGADRQLTAHNVLGEPLEICSIKAMTGFYRDGCCSTGRENVGSHTVCVVITAAFLDFSK